MVVKRQPPSSLHKENVEIKRGKEIQNRTPMGVSSSFPLPSMRM